MKCLNCGTELSEGQRFCYECGTQVPQIKKCIQCGAELPMNAKFCPGCGTKQDGLPGNIAGLSIGDKNVFAGDVIGSKEETNISGNATFIKNEDETKKTAKCHVCGRIIMRLDGYDCPSCGQFTCRQCYIPELGKCVSCRDNSGNAKETTYKQAVEKCLADNRIDINERQELMALQKQLGISITRALELEEIVKNQIASKSSGAQNSELSSYDKLQYEKSLHLLYEEGIVSQTLPVLEGLYKSYSFNEEILGTYLEVLTEIDVEKAIGIIRNLNADIQCAFLTEIDIASKNKDFTTVEKKLSQAESYWSNSILLKCRRIEFFLSLFNISSDTSFIEQAKQILAGCGSPTTRLEKSWLVKSERAIKLAQNEQVPEITYDYCNSLQVYPYIISKRTVKENKYVKMSEAELLELESQTHDPEVQYYLWQLYKSFADSWGYANQQYKWASKSAEQNYPDGIAALSFCCINGLGCEKQLDKGKQLLKQAKDLGSVTALYLISSLSSRLSLEEAFEMCYRAAQSGSANAKESLASMYLNGKGVAQDEVKAFHILKELSESTYAIGKEALASCYLHGNGVSQDIRQGINLLEEAVSIGSIGALLDYASLCCNGNVIPKDIEKSKKLFQKIIEIDESGHAADFARKQLESFREEEKQKRDLEEQRRKDEERQSLILEEQRRVEEEQRRKDEERQKQILENQRRVEEEQRRKDEEEKQRLILEYQHRVEEDQRRKDEEEKQRLILEYQRRVEEERQKKILEEQRKVEEYIKIQNVVQLPGKCFINERVGSIAKTIRAIRITEMPPTRLETCIRYLNKVTGIDSVVWQVALENNANENVHLIGFEQADDIAKYFKGLTSALKFTDTVYPDCIFLYKDSKSSTIPQNTKNIILCGDVEVTDLKVPPEAKVYSAKLNALGSDDKETIFDELADIDDFFKVAKLRALGTDYNTVRKITMKEKNSNNYKYKLILGLCGDEHTLRDACYEYIKMMNSPLGGGMTYCVVGWLYLNGHCEIDVPFGNKPMRLKKAKELLEKSASAYKNPVAKYLLAENFYVNESKEVTLLTESAKDGYYRAQYKLGRIYQKGKLVKQDNKEAMNWFQQASEKGYGPAKKQVEKYLERLENRKHELLSL